MVETKNGRKKIGDFSVIFGLKNVTFIAIFTPKNYTKIVSNLQKFVINKRSGYINELVDGKGYVYRRRTISSYIDKIEVKQMYDMENPNKVYSVSVKITFDVRPMVSNEYPVVMPAHFYDLRSIENSMKQTFRMISEKCSDDAEFSIYDVTMRGFIRTDCEDAMTRYIQVMSLARKHRFCNSISYDQDRNATLIDGCGWKLEFMDGFSYMSSCIYSAKIQEEYINKDLEYATDKIIVDFYANKKYFENKINTTPVDDYPIIDKLLILVWGLLERCNYTMEFCYTSHDLFDPFTAKKRIAEYASRYRKGSIDKLNEYFDLSGNNKKMISASEFLSMFYGGNNFGSEFSNGVSRFDTMEMSYVVIPRFMKQRMFKNPMKLMYETSQDYKI